jgi:predicted nucleotidyltransferase
MRAWSRLAARTWVSLMKTRIQQITEVLSQRMPEMRVAYRVKTIGVFGSAVRGDDTATSDIDILVEFSEPVGFFAFLDLEEDLSRILERRVDLVTRNALKPALKDAILRDVVYV